LNPNQAESGARDRGTPALVALDFDGTIKPHTGSVGRGVLTQIRSLRRRGVIFVLVTGRCLGDLEALVRLDDFDALVAENGAITVVGRMKRVLAPPWWCHRRGKLAPTLRAGCEEIIISMSSERIDDAETVARDLGGRLEWNKDRVMILPPGVNKATGLAAILSELGLSPANAMCIGDGENDVPVYELCGLRAALKNSVQQLKDLAHYISDKEDGEGVVDALIHFFGPEDESHP
jgi:hydroxymethylpyrimidine pyrophosphatase-like HAD family hydrolase